MVEVKKTKYGIPVIIVIGTDHPNTLGIIRSLGEEGIKPIVIILSNANNKSFVSKSKYIDKIFFVEEDQLLNFLLKKFSNNKIKPIIILSCDSAVSIIDNSLNGLERFFVVPNCNHLEGEITCLMNKAEMVSLACKAGLKVPESKAIYNIDGIFKAPEEVYFPCIVKPLLSKDGRKEDIKICQKYEELTEALEKLQRTYKALLIQDYINFEEEIGIMGLTHQKLEKPLLPLVVKKIRTNNGSTTYGKTVSITEIDIDVNKIERFLSNSKYEGIFDFEFVKADGEYYFIEIHFRNGAYGYAFTKAGINFPLLWIYSCLDYIKEQHVYKKISFMNEFADLKNIKAKKIGLIKWIKDFFCSNVYLYFNYRDISPFFTKIIIELFRKTVVFE
jgi:predicted ATP-grasp superfamily ATP-dependent carboligase